MAGSPHDSDHVHSENRMSGQQMEVDAMEEREINAEAELRIRL
jgi:hypothetical protein